MDGKRGEQGAGIEPITRALLILEMLNRRALTTLADLHADTGLPKSTLVRLLQALMADGYVVHVSRTAGYRLGARVLSLTSGYHPSDQLVDVAQPLMDRFTQLHKWPLYLATPEEICMRVRYSSVQLSPVAPDHQSAYHYRLSMLVSALGKAYLGTCPRAARRLLLAAVTAAPDVQDGQWRDRASAEALLADVGRNGYATTGFIPDDRGRGLAVPLRQGRRVIGAISMRHYRSTVSEAKAVQRYLGPLQELALAIGDGLQLAKSAANKVRAAQPVKPLSKNRKST
ncbi:MAG: helix-turn-helix domain-containing protein [Pseudomonadota bacterium]